MRLRSFHLTISTVIASNRLAGGRKAKRRISPVRLTRASCASGRRLGILVQPALLLFGHALFQSLRDDVARLTRGFRQVVLTDA